MRSVLLFLIASTIGPLASAADAQEPQAQASPAPSKVSQPSDSGFSELQQLLKLRDPFKKMLVKQTVRTPKTTLESFPADSFKMVGVLTGPERLRAMLLDPDGKTHIVSENMKIGIHDGVIRRIYSDRIVVREKFANIFGQLENVDQEIKLEVEKRPASAGSAGAGENGGMGG